MSSQFTPEEQSALKELRECVSDFIDSLDEYESHDKNLIRWLRARDLNVKKAERMFRKLVKYREENEDFRELQHQKFPESMLDRYPFRVVGHDIEGVLIASIPAGCWDIKSVAQAGNGQDVLLHVSQILERFSRFFKSSYSVEDINPQVVLILDLNHFSIPQALSKPVISTLYELARLLDAHYPEFMKFAYVINVPTLFTMLWTVVKHFLAPRILEKVKFIGGGRDAMRKVLLESIDSAALPSEYGGSNTAVPMYSNSVGESVPPRAHFFNSDDFVSASISPKQKLDKSFELNVGDRISWNFKSDSHDIGFSFLQNGEPMFPYLKAESHICVQVGLVDVVKAGTYSLVFDNSHSKYRTKTLHYAIRIEKNGDDNYIQ